LTKHCTLGSTDDTVSNRPQFDNAYTIIAITIGNPNAWVCGNNMTHYQF
jgi:hypothetical protein